MLRAFILSIITVASLLSFSFKPKKLKTPPGTVFLKENLFIDKTEVGNVHWREFAGYLFSNKKDTMLATAMLPDTTVWNDMASAFVQIYYRHPSYNYYPVVGVSYEQAIEFCKWRTEMVNDLFFRTPEQNPLPGKKFRYKLPTEDEWEFAASGKLDKTFYPFGKEDSLGRKGVWKNARLFNVWYPSKTKVPSNYTSSLNSFLPNKYHLYNLIGNVSEMIFEKGIAKGGNFLSPLEESKVSDQQVYTKPEAWLGFRCICEVIE